MASGGAWEGTHRLAGVSTVDVSFLATSEETAFLRQSPEPRAFTNCFHYGQNVCMLKNWLLTVSISQGAEWPSSGNTGLCYHLEGSIPICTGKWQNPPKLVEILLLQEAELSSWSFLYENPWLLRCFLYGNLILHQLFEMYNSPSSITLSPFSSACYLSAFQIK